jgi:hypothetical protein
VELAETKFEAGGSAKRSPATSDTNSMLMKTLHTRWEKPAE